MCEVCQTSIRMWVTNENHLDVLMRFRVTPSVLRFFYYLVMAPGFQLQSIERTRVSTMILIGLGFRTDDFSDELVVNSFYMLLLKIQLHSFIHFVCQSIAAFTFNKQ